MRVFAHKGDKVGEHDVTLAVRTNPMAGAFINHAGRFTGAKVEMFVNVFRADRDSRDCYMNCFVHVVLPFRRFVGGVRVARGVELEFVRAKHEIEPARFPVAVLLDQQFPESRF